MAPTSTRCRSLPVGIGIDYGYYVLSLIVEEYQKFGDHDRAIEEALMTTGRAIMFTGTTLTVSVIFWIFFPMKFQSEMAVLLTLLLFFHAVGALAFIPGTVSLLKPRFPLPNKVMLVILACVAISVSRPGLHKPRRPAEPGHSGLGGRWRAPVVNAPQYRHGATSLEGVMHFYTASHFPQRNR